VNTVDRSGFLKNLVRFGMVVGFWLGVAAVATSGVATACVFGGLLTAFSAVLFAWDVRRAWKEHRSQ
jgi:predicted MFS family arabinose efflux permease